MGIENQPVPLRGTHSARRQSIFITFEGSEGSGKSTQAKLLYHYLKSKQIPILHLREPGGTKISEAIRKILLDVQHRGMTHICETLLYMAARAQLVEEIILPALKKGVVVICDRFLDSTITYQGCGNGVDLKMIKNLGSLVTQRLEPDITFLLDLPTQEGLRRRGKSRDRIERRSLVYHNRVRRGYLDLARQNPQRIKVIQGQKSKSEIQKTIRQFLKPWLKI